MLNSRMRLILRELMAAETPITGTYLANLNNVTARTTREDVKNLDAILAEQGANVISIMGKGYKLTIMNEQQFHSYLQTISYEDSEAMFLPESPEDRIRYLVKRLLLSEGYLKLDDLADEMYVSRSTIQNDIKYVKELLNKYDLRLESRPNYGLKVEGTEMKLRYCMAEYIFDREEGIVEKMNNQSITSILKEDMEAISQIIMKQINTHQITLSDIAINNLLIHLAIAYKRIKGGYHVTLYKTDLYEISNKMEYEVAKEIVKEVEEVFQVDFPQSEVAYIAIHLLGTKMLSHPNEVVEQVMDEEILHIVTIALENIESEYNLGIKNDKELILGLSLHLKPAVNRYRYGMNIRNPMLEDIKKNYPLAFEAGIIAGLAIENYTETEMDENEVGYLALHIGAAIERKKLVSGSRRCLIVCASGLGTSQLIYYKLKAQFGKDLDVIGTTEYYRLNEYNLQNIDFIVSSIPINEALPVPVVKVNAILGDRDLDKIREIVIENKQHVHTYFKQELLFLRRNFHSKEEVLEFLYMRLLDEGLVDHTFLTAVYEREEVAPTSFGNLVAIPHPITPKSEHTFLAVCTLEKPIIWEDKPVQFICLLCVKKNSLEDLQGMYDLLGKVIDNSSIVEKLIKTKTYRGFINVLIE